GQVSNIFSVYAGRPGTKKIFSRKPWQACCGEIANEIGGDAMTRQIEQSVDCSGVISQAAHLAQVRQIDALARGLYEVEKMRRPSVMLRSKLVEEGEADIRTCQQTLLGRAWPLKTPLCELRRKRSAGREGICSGADAV